MTDEKILEVLDHYEVVLRSRNAEDRPFPHDELRAGFAIRGMDHLVSMIPKLREFVAEGRREKAFRWLGFIQGVLWEQGLYTLEQLKNHNRPDNE